MNPLAMKRKMFEEMKEVSKSDGAEALRGKYGPQEEAPPEMEAGGEDMAEMEPVPGAEEEGGEMGAEGMNTDALEAALASMTPEELEALLAGQ
jgi:hypothetical protein